MDPVSIAGLLKTSLTLTKQVIGYLTDVYNANSERKKFLDEINGTRDLLTQLSLKSEAKWGDTMKVLATANGPLEKLETTLNDLENRLRPSGSRLKKFGTALKWPFNKPETENIITSLERSKSLLTLALQRDLM